MEREPCWLCDGTGKCIQCRGKGTLSRQVYVICRTCEGDGDVWADGGLRRVTCPQCGASCEVLERNTYPCDLCGGTGGCIDCESRASRAIDGLLTE